MTVVIGPQSPLDLEEDVIHKSRQGFCIPPLLDQGALKGRPWRAAPSLPSSHITKPLATIFFGDGVLALCDIRWHNPIVEKEHDNGRHDNA